MPVTRILWALCLSLALLATPRAWASRWTFAEVPADLDQVDVYLHTLDIGNEIYNNFGHTAIRVHDKVSGQDWVFNWGMFDFGDPISFGIKFYQGILIYKLGVYPYGLILGSYQDENRTVWEDKLNLTSDQKQVLLDRLVWNSRDENRSYAYQYFFDNCSTRPRDYIDEALDGKVRQDTQSRLTPDTFRDFVYRGYQFNPGMDLFLDVAMNSRIDRNITVWEQMFHPLYLRDVLLHTEMDGKALVTESRVLAPGGVPTSYWDLAYRSVLFGVGLPLLLISIVLYRKREAGQKNMAQLYRLWALVSLPLVSFGALVGLLMPVTWVLSAHLDLHHNANQWLFWPFDFVLIVMVLKVLLGGRPLVSRGRRLLFAHSYLLAHIFVTLALPIMAGLGLIQQNVSRPVVYLLPPYILILAGLWKLVLQRKEAE